MNDELVATAELGEAARSFLDSELGKVMVGFADQEASLALFALATVDPTDAQAITKLQNKVMVANWFTQWLRELVDEGDGAINAFKQQQET